MNRFNVVLLSALIIIGIFIGLTVISLSKPVIAVILGSVIALPLFFIIPRVFLGILLISPPFYILWYKGGITPQKLAYSFIFAGLFAAGAFRYLIDVVFKEKPRDLRSPVFWPLVGFLGMALLGAINGIASGFPFPHWTSDLNGISFYGLYFIIAVWVTKADSVKKMFLVMAIASLIGVCVSVTMGLKGIHWPPGVPLIIYIAGVPFRKFGLPSDAGMVMFLTALALAIYLKASVRKWLCAGLALIFGLEQILGFTRARWLGDIAGTAFLFLLITRHSKKKLLRFFMVVTILLCVLVITAMVYPVDKYFYKALFFIEKRFSSIFTSMAEPSISTRVSEWEEALKKAMLHPIFGNGLGTSITYYRYDKWYGTQIWETTRYIHNSYVYYFLQMGLLGLLLFGWLSFSFIKYGAKTAGEADDDYYKGLATGFTSSFIAILVASMFTPAANNPVMTIWIGFLMGAIYIIDLKNKKAIE